jgi:hypothetical protein
MAMMKAPMKVAFTALFLALLSPDNGAVGATVVGVDGPAVDGAAELAGSVLDGAIVVVVLW